MWLFGAALDVVRTPIEYVCMYVHVLVRMTLYNFTAAVHVCIGAGHCFSCGRLCIMQKYHLAPDDLFNARTKRLRKRFTDKRYDRNTWFNLSLMTRILLQVGRQARVYTYYSFAHFVFSRPLLLHQLLADRPLRARRSGSITR